MADRTKKRKKTHSPKHSGASHKRIRQASAPTASNNGPGSGSTLPTSTDWRFRLKVISSAIEVADEVFEEAVQGLVQICFPETVLEELGVEVIAAHMQQDNAPQENVERMRSIFKSAMIQRVAWMLAQYSDTPGKLESAISALTDASRALHGQRQSQEVVSDSSSIGDDTSASSDEASESSEDEEIVQRKYAKKTRKKGKTSKTKSQLKKKKQQDAVDEADNQVSEVDTVQCAHDEPAATRQGKPSVTEEKKVSKKWRWNVDAKGLTADDIADIFKITSDLFAYHALPVVQQQLGPAARRKVIRNKIQSVLDDMPDDEYQQWVDSLRNLHKGDTTMLERATAKDSGRNIARATPAPTSRRLKEHDDRATRWQQDRLSADVDETTANPISVGGPPVTVVKREHGLTDLGQEAVAAGGAVGKSDDLETNSSAFDRISPKAVSPRNEPASSETPIVDLLWGPSVIDNFNRGAAAGVLMKGINDRVSRNSINVTYDNGATQIASKQMLHHLLGSVTPCQPTSHLYDPTMLRCLIESQLVPWVISNPTSFPELIAQPLFFASLMPCSHTVLNLLYKDRFLSNCEHVKRQITFSLKRRYYPSEKFQKLQHLIVVALKRNGDGMTKRAKLERILRHVAFNYRNLFPELKNSSVVNMWQRTTGQNW